MLAMLSRFEFDMAGDEHMTDPVNEQLSACLDGELPAAELDLLLKRLERNPELRESLGRYTAHRRGPAPHQARRRIALLRRQGDGRGRSGARSRAPRSRACRRVWFAACVRWPESASLPRSPRWRSSRSSEPALHRDPIAANEPAAAPTTVVAQNDDDAASYIVPTRLRTPAFVPATRLTNYVVAHSEYSSPLARRSVLTGVLAEDDGDPDVATDGEQQPQSPPNQSQPARRSLNNASMALLQILRRPGRRRAHGDELGATRRTVSRASGWSACPNRSPPATTTDAICTCATRVTQTMRIIHRVEKGKVTERLVSLDGSGREIIRNQNEVICYLPDRRTVLVEKRTDDRTLMATVPLYNEQLEAHYSIERGAFKKALGRRTQVILVQPRDQYRYGYRLWLDDETAMPLMSQLCDRNGNVIEQIVFAELNFRDRIAADAVKPAVDGEGFRWVRQDAQEPRMANVPLGWNMHPPAVRVPR